MTSGRDMLSERLSAESWESARRQIGDSVLSVIMPAHNLGNAIARNVRLVRDLFSGRLPFEIVVVDDGSVDNTRQRIEEVAAACPEVRPVFLCRNAGKGGALMRGFHASRGRFVLLLDADLDLPPHLVLGFFETLEQQHADIVIGSKRHPDSILDYPWHRKLASTVYYGLVKLLIGLPVRDTQTGIKLFRREVLEWVVPRMLVKQFAFDLELLAIAHEKGYRVAEAPVKLEFRARLGSLRPRAVRDVMIDTLAIFYRTRILRYYQTIRHTEMPASPPLVSIVIAYPAPSPNLDQCLDAISRQTCSGYEVLLLPDAPHPPSSTSRFAAATAVRTIPTGRIRPAEKRNIGIREARGAVVAFLDDDAYPAEDWLQHALVYFGDDAVAAVGGPGVTPPEDPFLAQLSGRVLSNPFVSGNYVYRYLPTRVQEVEDFPSCNLLVRADVLRELGGFRAEFWPGEDTYLCLEIVRKLRRRILYDPRVLVYHHRRGLFRPHLRQIGRYALHRGHFARRFPETSRKLSYVLPTLLVAGVAGGAAVSPFSPILRAVYLAVLAVYGGITFLSCVTRHPLRWLLTWLGVLLTHATYGVRFPLGYLSPRMPDEVRPFDHASEEKQYLAETRRTRNGGSDGGE